MTKYLEVHEVIELNRMAIERFGGTHGVRDEGALHSAVARPRSGYYNDVIEEAAALFESLSQNHPFLDGNKRTAIAPAAVFLLMNGRELKFNDLEAYTFLIGLYETGQMTRANLDVWMRSRVH
jgi:death-on-curing protein